MNEDWLTATWYAKPNDLIGGWCVGTDELPPSKASVAPLVADFISEAVARHVAALHNRGVPELWSVSEAAQFLGVSNQRINRLADAHPGALPAVMKLAGSRGARIWRAESWRRFAARRTAAAASRSAPFPRT